VQRLREKGCVVRGIGQQGKTGDETQSVYDDFTVLEHRKAAASEGEEAPARPARKTAARKTTAAKKTPASKKAPAAKKAAAKTAAAKTPARKTSSRKAATPAPAPEPEVPPPPPPPASEPVAADRNGRHRASASVRAVLDCLPELAAGQSLALNTAVQRLREAQLLGKNSSSLKLFAQLSDRFELVPADKPTQVRFRG